MNIYGTMPGIRARRRARGISVQDAAAALGLSRQAWYKWEYGIAMPAAALLPAIAELLGCTIEELYEGEEDDGQTAE